MGMDRDLLLMILTVKLGGHLTIGRMTAAFHSRRLLSPGIPEGNFAEEDK
jgi:hypothetical protein